MGFIGNILGDIVELVSPGIPIVGGKLGQIVGGQARKLPFKKGGQVMATHMMPNGSMMKGKTHKTGKPKKMKKGSKQARDLMASLRAMRKK